jgi:MFS family permease
VLVALQHRDFRLLFFAHVVSGVGGQLLTVSNYWQVYAITESGLALGATGIARAIPIILFSLIGGIVADRVDRRKIMIVTQASNGAVAVVLALLTLSGQIQVWQIWAAVFINAMVTSAAGSTRYAVIASVVPREHLMNAMALNSWIQNVDKIFAPALAGFLIALVGPALAYGINGVSHLVTVFAVLAVQTSLLPQRTTEHGSPIADLKEGFLFMVRQKPIILVVLLMDASALGGGSYIVLFPIVAGHFEAGPAGFGLLSSAPAIGSLLAASVLLSLGDFHYKGYMIAAGLCGYAFSLALLGLAPWFAVALLAAAGLGLSDSLQGVTRNTLIQLLTPDELRGRVGAFRHIMIGGTSSTGQGILGTLASAFGHTTALVLAGTLCAAVNIGMLLGRRDLRARELGMEAGTAASSLSPHEDRQGGFPASRKSS